MSRRFAVLMVTAVLALPAAAGPTAMAGDPSVSPASRAVIDITTTSYRAEPVAHTGGRLTIGATVAFPCGIILYTGPCNSTYLVQGLSMLSLWNATPDHKWFPQLTTMVPTSDNGGVVIRPDGGMDVRIELIPGARWSDGQPITCRDVSDTVAWVMDMARAGLWAQLGFSTVGWEDVTAVDGGAGTSCVAHFARQYSGYLALWAPLLPAHYLATVPISDVATRLYPTTDLASGVYSGPYRPTTWVDGQEVGFVPSASFWETIRPGSPPFDAVAYRHLGSPDALIAAFAGGEVDVAMELSQADLPKLAGFPAAQVDAAVASGYEQLTWNRAALARDFGDDGAAAILEALHYAVDKRAIVDGAVGGVGEPICDPVSPLDWYYHDTGPCPAHDPARAEEILDAGGFTKGADGIRARDGVRLESLACTAEGFLTQVRLDTLTLLAAQLRQVGIGLDVTLVSFDYLWGSWDQVAPTTPCNMTHGNFGVAELGYGVPPLDPTVWYATYHSSKDPALGDHSGANYARVDDREVDQALETVSSSVDLADVKAAMGRLQEIYVDPARAFPEIPLYPFVNVLLRSARMHNVVNNTTTGSGTWNIEDWWRDP